MRTLRERSGLDQIRRDMEKFCVEIGARMAGSPQEKQAADYTAQRFEELNLRNIASLPFSCVRWIPGRSELVLLDGSREQVPCMTFAHSACTPEDGIEGELVLFEPIDYVHGLRRGDLKGKIGLFYGLYTESAKVFAELQNSDLAGLIFVDTRLQADWPIANGMGEKFMRLVRKPMTCISLMHAWEIVRRGVRRVRLTCTGKAESAVSYNVVGELPGTDPSNIIVVCGHLDSVALGVGADDDASGVAAVLECVRRLRALRPRHTLRFIAFGTEEQLSVGSTRYVREQAKDIRRIGFVCNFDGIAAWVGISEVMSTGTPALDSYVQRVVEKKTQFGRVVSQASPYQDQFPFCARGIPGIWFTRKTHPNIYWYHHSPANNLDVCCMEQIAWTAEIACEILGDLATRKRWPFPRRISARLKRQIEEYCREQFD